jgi:hypothetical protein
MRSCGACPPTKSTFSSIKKFAKFGEITFYLKNQIKGLTSSHLVRVSLSFAKFSKVKNLPNTFAIEMCGFGQ